MCIRDSVNCSNIIFSYNGRYQTEDLYTCSDKAFYLDNSRWGSSPPIGRKTIAKKDPVSDITIAPNPITEASKVGLQIPDERSSVKLTVSNIIGQTQQLFQGDLNNGYHELSLENLDLPSASGLYFLTIQIGTTITCLLYTSPSPRD